MGDNRAVAKTVHGSYERKRRIEQIYREMYGTGETAGVKGLAKF
jgi:hypothetical protein